MEEPVLTMDVTRLRAEPGGQAQLSVKVKNPGHLVESFHMDVVGLDPSWWQVHPPELNIYPGKEESAVVLLKPPANAQAPDEALPFGVRAVSTLDAQRTVVEEGDLEIGRVLDLQASITPVTSRGRWTGRHTITYQNWGNSPTHLRLSVSDKDESLGFRLEPEQVSVPVGSSATARLRVRPRNPFLRGAAVHRTFQVVGESMGAAPPPGTPRSVTARAGVPDPGRPVLDGGIQHLPILSKGVVVLAGLLVAAIAGLVFAGMKTSAVIGARTPDVAPQPPTQLVAEGVSAELIQLRWAPSDRAELYRVQRVDEATNAVLGSDDVKDGATAFGAKVDQPLTRACYQVIAVRGPLASGPSEKQCSTSGDGRLPPPTNVQATEAPGGFNVAWTDSDQNEHTVLVDGAPVGAPSPAGVKNVTVPVPAGRHCITVVGKRGATLSSPPSDPPVCVLPTAPPTSAAPTALAGAGAGGGAGGAATGVPGAGGAAGGAAGGGAAGGGAAGAGGATGSPTAPAAAAALGPFVAVVGPPYQEQALADTVLKQIQTTVPTAQLVPVAQLPQLRFVSGLAIVVPGFTTLQQAQQFCTTPRPGFPPGCQAVPTAPA
jgi:hypothetical protein